MPYVAAVMAIAAIYSGVSSMIQGKKNARTAEAYANWNATNLRVMGEWQADAINKFSHFNAALVLRGAAANAGNALSVAYYNADLQEVVAEHNTALLTEEAAAVWTAEKLDEKLLEQKVAQIAGEQVAGYAAAGVIANEGTPLEAVLDTKTQGEFERHILQFNANEQARALLNAATQGEWEAEIAGDQMIYEAKVNGMNAMNSARVTAAGMLAQGSFDAEMARWGATQNAQKTTFEGNWQASQFRTEGSQALIGSLFKAAGSVVSAYGSSYTPSAGTTAATSTFVNTSNYDLGASNTHNFVQNYNFQSNYDSLLTN